MDYKDNTASLTYADFENLAASFITKKRAVFEGLCRIGDIEGAEIVGRKPNANDNYSGIVFPIYHPTENDKILAYRLRLDTPIIRDGKEQKYLTAPGARNHLIFSRSVTADDLQNIALPVIFTEGHKQCFATDEAVTLNGQRKYLVVATTGVSNFNGTVGRSSDGKQQKGLITDFQNIALRGRDVIILPDPDYRTNKNVFSAIQKLAQTLAGIGANVYIVDCPNDAGNGIDDVLGYWEREYSRETAINKFLELLQTKRAFKIGSYSETLLDGTLTIDICRDGRKYKISVFEPKNNNNILAVDSFNIAEAAKRRTFLNSIELSPQQKKEVDNALMRLSGLVEGLGKNEETLITETDTIETSFKLLLDGRIIEQVYGGFALYDPNTKEHEIVEFVIDSDNTKYIPIADELFSEPGGLYIADSLTEYGSDKDLLSDIENFVRQYLDLKPLQLKLTAYYIIFTYLFDKVLELPYLNATGDPGSGKSRFGLVAAVVSYRGLFLVNSSPASVYRITDKFKPTLFIDEFNDTNSDDATAVIQILNAGFQKTGKIARQVKTGDGQFQTELFDPYGPKIIGSLKQSKSNAFNSRCIEIKMEPTTRNDIPLRLSVRLLKQAQTLRNKLTLFRLRRFKDDLETKLDKAEKELKEEKIVPRSIQINTPLFALIEDKEIKQEFIELLKGRDAILAEEKSLSIDGEIVDRIHTLIFDGDEINTGLNRINYPNGLTDDGKVCEQLRVERLLDMINIDRPHKIAPQNFGKILIGLGLYTGKIHSRASSHRLKKAVIFDRERLGQLFTKYNLPVSEDFNVTNVTKTANSKHKNDLIAVTLSENGQGESIQCYQDNLSNNSTYKNGNIGNIKVSKNDENNKKHYREIL